MEGEHARFVRSWPDKVLRTEEREGKIPRRDIPGEAVEKLVELIPERAPQGSALALCGRRTLLHINMCIGHF